MSILYIIVFSLVAIITIYYLFFAKAKEKPEDRQRDFSIENVSPNGKIAISNFGDNSEFLNITITEKTRHHEGDNFWYELKGNTSEGEIFWLQIESIDPVELNGGKEDLNFNSLGLSTRDLETLRIEQKAFTLNEEQFYFESGGEAQVHQSDAEDEEDFRWYRYWNFTNEQETVFIAIQQLEDSVPTASLSYPINKSQLRIFELGENVE
jgi:hypothetical protein